MAKKIHISDELRSAAPKLWFMLMLESGRWVPFLDDGGKPFFKHEPEPLTESELDAVLSHLNFLASETVSHRPRKYKWRNSAIASEVDDRIKGGMRKLQAYSEVADYMQNFGPTFSANYVGTIYRAWKDDPKSQRGKIEIIAKDMPSHS